MHRKPFLQCAGILLGMSLWGGCGGGDFYLNPTLGSFLLTVRAVGPSEVALDWDPSPGRITAYDVYRDGVLVVSLPAGARTYRDLAVGADRLYAYSVVSVLFPTGAVALSQVEQILTPDTAPWTREDIADGEASSLVLDGAGTAHVAYYDFPGRRLRVATNAAGPWAITTVDNVTDAGLSTSMAMDGAGALHLAYAGGGTGLRYATNASGAWVTTLVDATETVSVALLLDGAGAAHIAASGARYSTNSSGAWAVQTVGAFAPTTGNVAIGLDSAGALHLAYLAGLTGALTIYHATNASGAWSETAALLGVGGPVALLVDGADGIHFFTFRNSSLVHVVGALEETIDTPGPLWGDLSATIDGAGSMLVAYHAAQRDLKVATNATGSWSSIFVAADGDVGSGNSIAVDPTGRAQVTYRDASRSRLVHAVERGP